MNLTHFNGEYGPYLDVIRNLRLFATQWVCMPNWCDDFFNRCYFLFVVILFGTNRHTETTKREKNETKTNKKKIFENLLAFMEICIDITFWLVDCTPNKTTIHAYAHGFTVAAFTGIPVSTMLAYPSKTCKIKTRIYDGYENKKYKTRTESYGLFQYQHKFKFWAINYDKKPIWQEGNRKKRNTK